MDKAEQIAGKAQLRVGTSFPLSTDSMVLADFVRLPKAAKAADLGSGSGTLGLLLTAVHPDCTVTGLELQESAHLQALKNIADNGLTDRVSSQIADLRDLSTLPPAGSFTCAVSNPPYFPENSGRQHTTHAPARSEAFCPLTALCSAAAHLLQYGGSFFLVHRPERLTDLLCALRQSGLEPKRIAFVRHREDGPLNLVLLESRRGGKPGLQYGPDVVLYHKDGTPTADYQRIYHTQGG